MVVKNGTLHLVTEDVAESIEPKKPTKDPQQEQYEIGYEEVKDLFTQQTRIIRDTKFIADRIVTLDDFRSAFKKPLIPVKLFQTDSSHNISHVALIPSADDVILPRADLCFRKGVLVLTVEGKPFIHQQAHINR